MSIIIWKESIEKEVEIFQLSEVKNDFCLLIKN